MNNKIVIILTALVVINILALYSIRPYGYNFSSMLRIAENEKEGVVPEYFQKSFVVFTDGGGYDGQYYYYTAMDPLIRNGLYNNPFRQQRVLYPLVARALSLGDVSLLPFAMYLTNLIAVAFGMYFFILIIGQFGLSPAWSLLYGLSPPTIMTVQYSLPSPLSMALIIAAVYFYMVRENIWAATAIFALAFLTREDTVMVLAPLVLWDFQSKRSFKRGAVLIASLVPFLIWQYYVASRLGTLATVASSSVISPVPFAGIFGFLKMLTFGGVKQTLRELSSIVVFVYFMAVAIAVLMALKKKRHLFYYVTLAYCVLSAFTVPSQWDNFNGLLRMFYGLFPFLVLSYGLEKSIALKYCAVFIAGLTFLTAVRIVFISPVFPFKVW